MKNAAYAAGIPIVHTFSEDNFIFWKEEERLI